MQMMDQPAPPDNWWVAAGAFVATFVGFGIAYTFSTFLQPLEQEFHASRGALSVVFSLAAFLYFTLGVVSGPLADRWGAQRLVAAGMFLIAAGLFAASAAARLVHIHLAYALGVGLGVGLSYVPALAAVQHACPRRRGLASGIAVSGIGAGTMVMPPLARLLVDGVGWRHAYLWLAALCLVLGAIAAWLVNERRPEEKGAVPVWTFLTAGPVRVAVGTRRFGYLYLSCLMCSFGAFVPFVHLVPYAVEHGADRSSAVLLLTVIGIASTCGRFVLGGLADRISRQGAVAMMYAGMCAAFVTWAASKSLATLVVVAVVYGTFYGGWVALLPALVAETFGTERLASIIGVLYSSVGVGTLVGPALTGVAFDLSHSYLVPILAAAGGNLIAVFVLRAAVSQPARVCT